MSILIVDDNKVVLNSISDYLALNGLSVDTAFNGLNALEKCQNFAYELIVVDHLMPIMNGIQFAKNVRQLESYISTPIIFMTTQGVSTVESFLKEGLFSLAIDKPLDNRALIQKINRLRSINTHHQSL